MNNYRHIHEWIAMGITFGLIAVSTLILSIITFGLGFVVVVGGLGWLWFKVIKDTDLGYYVPVSEEKNPDLVKLVYELRNKWHLRGLDVYISPSREINAPLSDFGRKFLILNQGILDAIPGKKHRSFVVGRELGHIGLWHSWLRMLAVKVEEDYKDDYVEKAFKFLATGYMRTMELSADRIGLLSCNSLKAALETMVFLELSETHPKYEDVKKAVVYLSKGRSPNNTKIKQIFSTHPEVYQRLYELCEFANEMKMV